MRNSSPKPGRSVVTWPAITGTVWSRGEIPVQAVGEDHVNLGAGEKLLEQGAEAEPDHRE